MTHAQRNTHNMHDTTLNTTLNTDARAVLVVGASRGTGLATVEALLNAGHHVSAFSRSASRMALKHPRLRTIDGDATSAQDVHDAVAGHDAVIVTLGISENPLGVRLFGASATPMRVRSEGTRHVIAAMQAHGVRRLIVQTTYGVGETADRLGVLDSLFFALLLKPQIQDTALQETLVRASGLDWVLAQPVHLTDATAEGDAHTSLDGTTRHMKVSRGQVARVLASAIEAPALTHRSVSISG